MAHWASLSNQKRDTKWGIMGLGFLCPSHTCHYCFSLFVLTTLIFSDSCCLSFFVFVGFADPRAAILNINLVNKVDLDKVLKAEVFVHSDGQLRVAHLILGYDLISSSFQACKYVIKAKDPRLHQIKVVVPSLIPEGVLQVELPSQFVAEAEASPSQPIIKEEE